MFFISVDVMLQIACRKMTLLLTRTELDDPQGSSYFPIWAGDPWGSQVHTVQT